MTPVRIAAWSVVASGLLAAGWYMRPFDLASRLPEPTRAERLADSSAPRGVVVADITTRDAFRAVRRPAEVPYDPQRVLAPPPPPVARPTLSLVGVVAGEDPTAVIEGFPGVDGARVVRRGDVVAGLTVRSIANAEVRITGLDTLWVLRVRTLW